MSADPLLRLLPAFGTLLIQHRVERKWTVEEFAAAIQLPVAEVTSMERGEYGPTLPEFFRIARGLGEEPVILLVDVIAAWRADPTDYRLYKSRASDLAKLYRLGYHHDPGDFRELPRTYSLIGQANGAANALNATRRSKRLPLLDMVLIYVRLAHVAVRADAEGQP
jgi:transcriptional regulator with XRE-family HTH domain